MFRLFRNELKILKFSKFFADQIVCFSPLSMYRELPIVVSKFGKSNSVYMFQTETYPMILDSLI